ncbi:uncharacterized protein LOC113370808 [Ctenocephalides felis]|uniref:uncharacterized protein LOC113370808 n=1 Tax=Ctenocephalides felis TaxID=7515 RepID=UPI000E6E2EC5|nr:uncharacterized protein LOC113370808 [Ctenocephalides felis]
MYKDEGYYDRKYANKMYCDKYPPNKKYSDENLEQCIDDFEALKSIKSRLGPPVSNRYQLKSAVIKIENKPLNDNTTCSSWKENVRSNVMNINMLRYELDQGNRYAAQKKVWELQKKFNAFDQYLYEKSKQEFNNRQSAYNERLERIESDMIQNLEKYQHEVNKKKQQLLQEQQEQVQQKHRRALEIKKQEEIRKERLKKKAELDAIFNSQKEFRTIYEEIVKKFGSYQDVISREVLTEFSDEVKVLVNDIDKLALKSKDGSTCPEDVIKAQQLVDGIRKQCSLINSEYCKAVTSIQIQNNAQTQRHTQKLDSPKTEYVEQVQQNNQ